jgi:hypothetical protein
VLSSIASILVRRHAKLVQRRLCDLGEHWGRRGTTKLKLGSVVE